MALGRFKATSNIVSLSDDFGKHFVDGLVPCTTLFSSRIWKVSNQITFLILFELNLAEF